MLSSPSERWLADAAAATVPPPPAALGRRAVTRARRAAAAAAPPPSPPMPPQCSPQPAGAHRVQVRALKYMDDGMLLRKFLAMYESDLASYSAIILDVRRMNAHGVLSELLQAAHLERDPRPGQVERLLRRRPRLLHPGAARYSVDILYTKAPAGWTSTSGPLW